MNKVLTGVCPCSCPDSQFVFWLASLTLSRHTEIIYVLYFTASTRRATTQQPANAEAAFAGGAGGSVGRRVARGGRGRGGRGAGRRSCIWRGRWCGRRGAPLPSLPRLREPPSEIERASTSSSSTTTTSTFCGSLSLSAAAAAARVACGAALVIPAPLVRPGILGGCRATGLL